MICEGQIFCNLIKEGKYDYFIKVKCLGNHTVANYPRSGILCSIAMEERDSGKKELICSMSSLLPPNWIMRMVLSAISSDRYENQNSRDRISTAALSLTDLSLRVCVLALKHCYLLTLLWLQKCWSDRVLCCKFFNNPWMSSFRKEQYNSFTVRGSLFELETYR